MKRKCFEAGAMLRLEREEYMKYPRSHWSSNTAHLRSETRLEVLSFDRSPAHAAMIRLRTCAATCEWTTLTAFAWGMPAQRRAKMCPGSVDASVCIGAASLLTGYVQVRAYDVAGVVGASSSGKKQR
jgi:hypothetical protein